MTARLRPRHVPGAMCLRNPSTRAGRCPTAAHLLPAAPAGSPGGTTDMAVQAVNYFVDLKVLSS